MRISTNISRPDCRKSRRGLWGIGSVLRGVCSPDGHHSITQARHLDGHRELHIRHCEYCWASHLRCIHPACHLEMVFLSEPPHRRLRGSSHPTAVPDQRRSHRESTLVRGSSRALTASVSCSSPAQSRCCCGLPLRRPGHLQRSSGNQPLPAFFTRSRDESCVCGGHKHQICGQSR